MSIPHLHTLPPEPDPETPDVLVLEAVREKLVRVDAEVEEAAQERAFADTVAAKARDKHQTAIEKRDKLTAYLARYQAGGVPTVTAKPVSAPISAEPPRRRMIFRSPQALLSNRVVSTVETLLADGRKMKTQAIFDALTAAGLEFAAEQPLHRISQILSLSEKFTPDRVNGWSLKQQPVAGLNDTQEGRE